MAHPSAKQLLKLALDTGDYDAAAILITAGALDFLVMNTADQTAEEKSLALRQLAAQRIPARARA